MLFRSYSLEWSSNNNSTYATSGIIYNGYMKLHVHEPRQGDLLMWSRKGKDINKITKSLSGFLEKISKYLHLLFDYVVLF